MRRTSISCLTLGLLMTGLTACSATPAWAQNDWQYPDPYFGILEIEKSHDGATARRYRDEVNPSPRSNRLAAPSFWQAPAKEPGASPAAAPAPVARSRWRNRWRR